MSYPTALPARDHCTPTKSMAESSSPIDLVCHKAGRVPTAWVLDENAALTNDFSEGSKRHLETTLLKRRLVRVRLPATEVAGKLTEQGDVIRLRQ